MKMSYELIEKIVAEIETSEDEIVEKVKRNDYYCFYNLRLIIDGIDYCSSEIQIKKLNIVNKIYKACFSEPTKESYKISFDYCIAKLCVDDDEVDNDIIDEINNKLKGHIERTNFIEY